MSEARYLAFGPRGVRHEPAATGPLQIEVRVALVASRLYDPERIPTLLARPQVRNFGSLSPHPDIGRQLVHVSRPARGTFLVGADGDTFWHVHFPVGPRSTSTVTSGSGFPTAVIARRLSTLHSWCRQGRGQGAR
jgi:hypothetical protein